MSYGGIIVMLDWSKSCETYLKLNDRQRLSIGVKSHNILFNEIDNLCEEPLIKPSLYLMALSQFISLRDDAKEKEYLFIRGATGYADPMVKFEELVKKGKDSQLSTYINAYFQKAGGEVLTAFLSMGLALMSIKGEISEEEVALLDKIHG